MSNTNTLSADTETDEVTDHLAAIEAESEIKALYEELTEQTRMVQHTRQLLTNLAKRRRDTVIALRESGQTHKQIADKLGVSKSAIQQILN